ncbi:MAG TPA: response regulator transcription factor [Chloroflexia bacterium]|jgi:DNA-binding NarL/FixJ family response regulator|nr:response regulator transcription factor [Chloroflexia bacterium]
MNNYPNGDERITDSHAIIPKRDGPIRVLVVDDQPVFTEMLRVVLDMQDDIKVVGMAFTGDEGLRLALEEDPDVLLVDYHMPMMTGLEVIQGLKAEGKNTTVVVLTADTDEAIMAEAIAAGAAGYITKQQALNEVVQAVRTASEGEPVVPPFMIPRILSHFHRQQQKEQQAQMLREKLSAREIEILEQLAKGHSNEEISENFVLSPNTVRTHIQNIIKKMGVHSKLQATTLALQLGIISVPRD